MQVLNSTRKHSTKNKYFHMPILFTTIYLMQEQKLNPRNYSKNDIIMTNFVQATENDVDRYARFEFLDFYGFL
jgi:hypothetical protein